ncbi:MAG: hypothetical protein E7812_10605 [Phenylobacterium sp.]|nr:MAG: hypothetical protein E7812_10605 [Phenylobacterium sp.]
MIRDKFEKLGSIFLVVFSTVLAAVLAADGMEPGQWFGSALAVMASISLALTVRAWPHPVRAEQREER